MTDSSKSGARKTLAVVVVALAVGRGATAAAQDPPAALPPSAGTAAPSSPPSSPSTPPEPTGPPAKPEVLPPPASPAAPGDLDDLPASFFSRTPLTVSVGRGARRWSMTFYGFVEADYIVDTTRSYNDAIGGALVARSDTFEGTVGRTQFSMRNTRLGFIFESPTVGGVKPISVLEGDFFGNQPGSPPSTSEAEYYDSPSFRMRHAYVKLQSNTVELLFGQTYDVFGWQNYFSPASVEFLGLPNQVFSRHGQIRLAHTFNAAGAVSVDVAASAVRPAQRDAQVPDADAGIRFGLNGWKGISTPGNVGTAALPLSVGVSGTVRQFKVNAFTPPPVQASNTVTGWGLSLDALIPIIPAANGYDRANKLTLTGSYVVGTGIGDLITSRGGALFPTLPNPAQANPPPLYDADIDDGLVSFDSQGVLHTIDWWAFRIGGQYYFPGSGRWILAVNYTQSHSKNLAELFPRGGAEIELLGSVANTSRYADANLFWDATAAVRFGLSGQYTQVEYLDGNKPHNIRGMGQALYVF